LAILQFLYYLLKILHPFLIPICLISAWVFILILGWSLWHTTEQTLSRAKQMHEIPCTRCRFFTNDHYLKCTVQPKIANTEEAINCSDYRPESDF
jgi:hypothetical protein